MIKDIFNFSPSDLLPTDEAQIKNALEEFGIWKGFSYEWRNGCQNEISITKLNNENLHLSGYLYEVRVKFFSLETINQASSFDMAIDSMKTLNDFVIDFYSSKYYK